MTSQTNRLKEILKNLKFNESTISMVLGALVVVVVGALLLNYFRGVRKSASEAVPTTPTVENSETTTPASLPTTYKVNQGDSLWKIAQNLYGSGYNWVDIAKENQLSNPNLLAVNQELSIPKVEVRVPQPPIVSKATSRGEPITSETYTVVKGDNLWNIAVRAYGDGFQWVKIASENKLDHPGLIHSGNVLRLPR